MKHKLVNGEIVSESNTMIRLRNGAEIHCLPGNNPDTIRGFSPTLLIYDEAAFIKDEVFVAAEPSLAATNGDTQMYSTPFGKRGRFYNTFQSVDFENFHIPSRRSPLITEEFLEAEKREKNDLEFLQEYEGEFMEEADNYFGRELILNCIEEFEDSWTDSPKDGCEYYLGVDCARYGLDETVYIVIENFQNHRYRVIFMQATSKKPMTDIIGRIKALHSKTPFKSIFIDSTGLGGGAVDVLRETALPISNWTAAKTQTNSKDGVQFTLLNKEEMYKNLKWLMEKNMIKFPEHKKLINQLSEMQYEYTEAGHLKIHHPNTSNSHDDYCDSLALACLGIQRRKSGGYISV